MPTADGERDVFRPVISEIESRPERKTRLTIVEGKPPLGAPGSLTVFVGKKGSSGLKRLEAAVERGGPSAEALQERLLSQYRKARKLSPPELAAHMPKEPVLGEVRYGGATLASGIYVPGNVDLAVIVLPYNGGRLATGSFEFVEHFKPDVKVRLEAVLVLAKPNLTQAERAALRLVPADQISKNVGHSADCDTTWWAVAVFTAGLAVAGALAVAALAAAAFTSNFTANQPHLPDSTIARLGPAASARRLLALRREYLLNPLGK